MVSKMSMSMVGKFVYLIAAHSEQVLEVSFCAVALQLGNSGPARTRKQSDSVGSWLLLLFLVLVLVLLSLVPLDSRGVW